MDSLYSTRRNYSKNSIFLNGRQKMKKLKNILQEVFEESPKVDKYKVVEGVKNFGIVGK